MEPRHAANAIELLAPLRWPRLRRLTPARDVGRERSGHSEMVKPTVGMSKREDEFRCGQFASESDDDTVDRPLTLHFDPVAATPSDIRAIRPFRDHALDVGQR